ncbi:MAG: ATP-dependent RNA helicase HrpA [Gammaproteobacteria bacterium]|nr:ATP-dependent RNA helicase HrpA [Gammaproteobacteria bacterium]MCP5137831.1 ATP-dependent RNA helicase HrpA [Gammaproteobacteria bacterium]
MSDSELRDLSARLDGCLSSDRAAIRKRLDGLQRRLRSGKPVDRGLAQLREAIETSVASRAERLQRLPKPEFDDALPISARRDEIAEAICKHQVVVVAGETGSGKTTQLPKICLSIGRGVDGLIGCTQPRRIAARSVAARVAEELKTPLGDKVGWKVRFTDKTGPDAAIKFMTDGILLAEMQRDRDLRAYDTLLIDEAHERSLNIDFLLGYLKQLLPRRPDLKLIITSATIDTARFAKHFNNAPVIEVSGRTFPVEVRYRPLLGEDADSEDRDLTTAILDAVDELEREDRARGQSGDVLIFLPGEREIRETAEALRKHHPPDTEVLPLYARLTPAEQNRVFQTHRGRRIVLATNVAETSLTVPGIRYVIDPGLARIARYSPHSKVQRLPIEKISQASANQRKGRCGRVADGVCIRLYDEAGFRSRAEFTDPEIRRSSLAGVILRMADLGLGAVEAFPFVEPPERKQINDGYKLLEELGAVDGRRGLSAVGRQLARLPVDPRLARMVLAAADHNALREVLIIAAALAIPDPRMRPAERQQAADQKHAQWKQDDSDFLAFVAIWDAWQAQGKHLSNTKLRAWAKENWLSWLRLREWQDVHQQLFTAAREHGLKLNPEPAGYADVHQSLLTGLLGNVGLRDEQDVYVGARNVRFAIFPGSTQRKARPKWLMSAELLETSRLFAHTVAKIQPEWVEQLAGSLLKRSYSEPHWEQRPAQVAAFERVTLYGLPLVEKRRVNYGRIDPKTAREIFIREALVQGAFQTRAPFFAHNRMLIAEIEDLEARARRRDLLADEEALFDFYDRLVPEQVYSGKSFETWRKRIEHDDPKRLFLDRETLLQRGTEHVGRDQYPDHLQVAGLDLPLEYHFDPGKAVDGISVRVPLSALNLLRAEHFEWLVPGLLRDKLVALLRGLPKSLRKAFVPVPDYADALFQALEFGRGRLREAMAAQLLRMSGVRVALSDWDETAIPEHLRINYKLCGDDGEIVAMGRDLSDLQARHGGKAQQSFAELPKVGLERERLRTWDFGDLPERVDLDQAGMTLHGYPALIDRGEHVDLKVFDDVAEATLEHAQGCLRLYQLADHQKFKYLRRNPGFGKTACLHYAPIGQCRELSADMVDAVYRHTFGLDAPPRSQAEFERRLQDDMPRLVSVGNELGKAIDEVLAQYHALRKALNGRLPPSMLDAATEIRTQAETLLATGFISATPTAWARRLPVYLKALVMRLDKVRADPERDRALAAQVRPFAELIRAGRVPDAEFRWMVEEFRVSLFAQGLRTVQPVSAKRLQAML